MSRLTFCGCAASVHNSTARLFIAEDTVPVSGARSVSVLAPSAIAPLATTTVEAAVKKPPAAKLALLQSLTTSLAIASAAPVHSTMA